MQQGKGEGDASQICKYCGAAFTYSETTCGSGNCTKVTVGTLLGARTGFGQPLLAQTTTSTSTSGTESALSDVSTPILAETPVQVNPAVVDTAAPAQCVPATENSPALAPTVEAPDETSEQASASTTHPQPESTGTPAPARSAPRHSLTWGAAVTTTPTTVSSAPFFSFGLPPRANAPKPTAPLPPIPLRKPSGPQLYDTAMFSKPKPAEELALAPDSAPMDVFDAGSPALVAQSTEFNVEDFPEQSFDPSMRTPVKRTRSNVGHRVAGPLDGVIMHVSKRKARIQAEIAELVRGQEIAASLARRVKQRRTHPEVTEDALDLSDATLIDLVTEDDYPGVRVRRRISDAAASSSSRLAGRTRASTVAAASTSEPSPLRRTFAAQTASQQPTLKHTNKHAASSIVSTPQLARSSRSMGPPSAQVPARPATQPRAAAISTPKSTSSSPITRAAVKPTTPLSSLRGRGPESILNRSKQVAVSSPPPATELRATRSRASTVGLGTPVQGTPSVTSSTNLRRAETTPVAASSSTRRSSSYRPVVELDAPHMKQSFRSATNSPSAVASRGPLAQTMKEATTTLRASQKHTSAVAHTQTSPDPLPLRTPAPAVDSSKVVSKAPTPLTGSSQQAHRAGSSASIKTAIATQTTAEAPAASSSAPIVYPSYSSLPRQAVAALPAETRHSDEASMHSAKTLQRLLTKEELSQFREPGRASLWLEQNYRLSPGSNNRIRQMVIWAQYQDYFNMGHQGPAIPPLIKGANLVSLLPMVFPGCYIGGAENDYHIVGLVRCSEPPKSILDGPRFPPLLPTAARVQIRPDSTAPTLKHKPARLSSETYAIPGPTTPTKGTKRQGGDDWDVLRESKRKPGRSPKPKDPDGTPTLEARLAYQPLEMRPRYSAPSSSLHQGSPHRLPPLPPDIPEPTWVATEENGESGSDIDGHEPPRTLMDENLLMQLKEHLGEE